MGCSCSGSGTVPEIKNDKEFGVCPQCGQYVKLGKDEGLYMHNDVTAIVSHCANPKCLMGRKKGEPAKIDQQGITPHAAGRSWPITTLADGSRVRN